MAARSAFAKRNLRRFRTVLAAGIALAVAPTIAHAEVADLHDMQPDEIVITARGFQQRIEQAPASISVLGREELRETRYQSLAEALANVEGVDVGASAGKTGGLNISIRGMPSDYTLVLIDGRRQNAAGNITPNGFGETSTSFLPPLAAIDRIEVVRGPVSTLYGSDAMGGVVNIITRRVGDFWAGSVAADATIQFDAQFGNIYGGNGWLQGPVVPDLVGLALRGRYARREASELTYELDEGGNAIVSQRGPSPVENEIWSAGGRVNITPHSDHDIMFDVDISRQWYDNSTGQLGTLGLAGYGPSQRFNQEEYVLAHDWRLSFGELQTSLSRGTRETLGRVLPSDVPGGGKIGDPRILEATNSILDSKFFSRIANHSFTIGGQYWDAEMIDGVAPAPYAHEQWALFAENEWRIVPPLALTVGVRRDDHSVFGDHISPRAYLVWNAADRWTLKGGISEGFKTPRLDQIAPGITGFTGQGTRPTIGTPTLQPETSRSIELALFYDNRSNFRANVALFDNKFDDKIASGVPLNNCSFGLSRAQYDAGQTALPDCADYGFWPAAETFAQTINIDEAVTRGIEAAFRWAMLPGLSLSGNYTFTHSEATSGAQAGTPLYDAPRHMLNGALRWAASDRLNLWLRGEYRSSRYRDEDSPLSRAKATWGDYRPYAVFHLGGGYQLTHSLSVKAAIYNLLDKDFVSYGSYVSDVNSGAIAYTNLYANNQEPRRLWLSANFDF